LSLSREGGLLTANIELLTDEITKDIENALEKKNLVQNLRKELKIYYECKMKNIDAEISKDRLDG
jgi:hypothetical protein